MLCEYPKRGTRGFPTWGTKAVLSVAAAVSAIVAAAGDMPRKKLIAHGWDLLSASTEDVYRNREKFAQTGYDGIALPLDARDAAGRRHPGRWIVNCASCCDADFAESVRLVRECVRCKGLGWSFGFMNWSPEKRKSWSDDAAWEAMAKVVGAYARAARQAGLKGLIIDHENYSAESQFELLPADGDYVATAAKARARGRQMFSEVFREFPDATILSFWLFAWSFDMNRSPDPSGVEESFGDLWGPFLNGMLDVLPPTIRLVDGNESMGYRAVERRDFAAAYWECTRPVLHRIAPENREKYLRALSVGFGLFLDGAKPSAKGSPWDAGELGGSRTAKFFDKIIEAVRVADEFVWIYGERGQLIDWDCTAGWGVKRLKSSPLWEDALPGLACACRAAVGDTEGYAEAVKRAGGSLTNVIENSACCSMDANAIPKPYRTYTALTNPPSALFAFDAVDGARAPGCLRLLDNRGTFTVRARDLKPGDIVRVVLSMKGVGASVVVAWQKDGNWNWKLGRTYLAAKAGTKPDEWGRTGAFFVVPDGANGLGISMGGKIKGCGPLKFDDICVFRMQKQGEKP